MSNLPCRFGLAVFLALVLVGCAPELCERASISPRPGDCGPEAASFELPERSQCEAALPSCDESDQSALKALFDCLEKLPVCESQTEEVWLSKRTACYGLLSSLSAPCGQALFDGQVPGSDAGVDAGLQPVNDGGHGLDLVVVADELSFALAWSPRQQGQVDRWRAEQSNFEAVPEASMDLDASTLAWTDLDAGRGVQRSYFVAGLGSSGELLYGDPNAGIEEGADAGGCSGPLDCRTDQVCDLGVCKIQACQENATCPLGYQCFASTRCVLVSLPDGGTPGGKGSSDGGVSRPLPLVSPPVTALTADPAFSKEISVSRFAARRPAMIAIDSARQFVALEQEGQLFGHLTTRRGADFEENDLSASYRIDTVGSQVALTYEPSSGTIFACYDVGQGVRVRRSFDLGRTWGEGAKDLLPPPAEDGGTQGRITDCALAPWVDGQALLATVDDDDLVIREINGALEVTSQRTAFVSSPADAGNVYEPQRPAIVTLPSELVAHVGFTASRWTSSGTDKEVYGLMRDPVTGAYVSTGRINDNGLTTGSGFMQDFVSLAVDPTSKRAVAAYTTLETQSGASYNTVYVSLFNPSTLRWGTGSDLSVFDQNKISLQYHVIPARLVSEPWDAFSPQLAITPGGRLFLSFLAGPQQGSGVPAQYRMYLVGFGFDATSPNANAKGWFLPPAKQMGATRAYDPSPGNGTIHPTNTAMAADSQLSVYTVLVEGVAGLSEAENRAVMISRP